MFSIFCEIMDLNLVVRYFLLYIDDVVTLVPVFLILLCFIWSGIPQGKEKCSAWWALFNGCIIHCWMEGIIGTSGRGPKWLVVEYEKLDSRYKNKDPTVMVIAYSELLIMGPLCIIWYNSILKKLWYRHFVAIVVSTFQLFGTIIYSLTEVYVGFKDLPLEKRAWQNGTHVLQPDSWPLTSSCSWNDIFYFWIVFVLGNLVWTTIPTFFILKSIFVFCPKSELEKKKH